MKIYELLSDESKWTKGVNARGAWYRPTEPRDPSACQWCLIGAADACYEGDEYTKVLRKISDYLHSKRMNPVVHVWNDNPDRTFEEVHSLCKELDV